MSLQVMGTSTAKEKNIPNDTLAAGGTDGAQANAMIS